MFADEDREIRGISRRNLLIKLNIKIKPKITLNLAGLRTSMEKQSIEILKIKMIFYNQRVFTFEIKNKFKN